ncbi:hypothetical protein BJV82DRAFT_615286 [Fennellomyces sp. T-0311]|nr:hypothetical protein BJV82DRAFT_615286 [Fennellomyces sp. T-0311]
MIVSAGAALTAAILLAPGAQAAPPFKPEDEFSTPVDGKDSAEDVDKDVVNDLADEWSSSDDVDDKGSEEEDLLPPDEQQDLNAMTEDLTVGNDDDDILDGNDGDDDGILTTSDDEESGEGEVEDTQAFKADVLEANEPEDPLVDDKVTDKDGSDLTLGLADDDVKEDDVIPLSEEDPMSNDGDAEETDDLLTLDDPAEELALEETTEDPIESELLPEGEEGAGDTQESELAVESPWDEQQSLQQDKEEVSKPIPDDGLDLEETPVLDGEETPLVDGEENPFSETDLLDNEKDVDLGNELDLDAATEYKEEHPSDDDYNTPVNDDGEIEPPIVESPQVYTPFADPPVDDDSQLSQDPEELDIAPSSEEASESDLLTDEYQVDTTIQEINDSFEKALDAVQPENGIPSQEDVDSFGSELAGAANDPSQAGFFPAENDNKSAMIGDDSGSSTLNMLLVLAVLILLLFKLPKIKVS